MHKKIALIFAVGGTAGHLYPAQALARELQEKDEPLECFFLGHGLKNSRYFDRQYFAYGDIASRCFFWKKPWTWPATAAALLRGIGQAFLVFKQKKPTLVVGFGSFHAFPVLVAARLCRVPYLLLESNAILGKVNAFFVNKALGLAYQLFEWSELHKTPFVKVKLPSLHKVPEKLSKEEARQGYGLDPSLKTLLIFGGSQGAFSLNKALIEAMGRIKEALGCFQVIHIIGFHTDKQKTKKAYESMHIPAYVDIYEENMSQAYRAADMLIARSGANAIAEQILFALPALFIPYPYLKDRHQYHNASYVADKIRGAFVLEQKELTPDLLALTLQRLAEEAPLMKQRLAAFQKSRQDLPLVDLVTRTLEQLSCRS